MDRVRNILHPRSKSDEPAQPANMPMDDIDIEAARSSIPAISHAGMETTSGAVEKPGVPAQQAQPARAQPSTQQGSNPSAPADQLAAFRQLVGITAELGLTSSIGTANASQAKSKPLSRAGQNVGIYASTVSREVSARRRYTFYSLLITGCLGLQVLIAAALTALGAASATHTVITVFGAVNTAIATFHSYLQGYGLPGRFKYYQNGWYKLRELIEQREREFSCAAMFGTALPKGVTLESAVTEIENLYRQTLQDVEATEPERFAGVTSSSGAGKSSNAAGTASATGVTDTAEEAPLSPLMLSQPFARGGPHSDSSRLALTTAPTTVTKAESQGDYGDKEVHAD